MKKKIFLISPELLFFLHISSNVLLIKSAKKSKNINIFIPKNVLIEKKKNLLICTIAKDSLSSWCKFLKNLLNGFLFNYKTRLFLNGVGFRAHATTNNNIEFKLGYSHFLLHSFSNDFIEFYIIKNTILTLSSPLKDLLYHEAMMIKNFRKRNPYKNKGIIFKNEPVVLKIGKKT